MRTVWLGPSWRRPCSGGSSPPLYALWLHFLLHPGLVVFLVGPRAGLLKTKPLSVVKDGLVDEGAVVASFFAGIGIFAPRLNLGVGDFSC
jgi:hypothetical protein